MRLIYESEKITSDDIRKALSETYQPPEWYLGFEVGNSTGGSCRRRADAVAINAYPSKGFEVRGFEIKVSKQDLKSELENGIKSDEIARFCDYWFLVVPKGLTDGFTLPPTWGVIEYIDGKLRHKTSASKIEKISPTLGFLCAMLRGRERIVIASAKKITAEREMEIRKSALWGVKDSERELRALREKLAEIKTATGIALDTWTPTQKIIDRLKSAASLDVIARNIKFIEGGAQELIKDAQEIQSAVEVIQATEQEGKP
jgi:hypothetical protein